MPDERPDSGVDPPPTCRRCDAAAEFWLYRPDEFHWRPLCEYHVIHLHPSIELRAWLASGYAKPVELGRPDGPPTDPPIGRCAAFRNVIDEILR